LLSLHNRDRILAFLLVGALLLCHGAFGSLHQLQDGALSGHPTIEQHSSHHGEHGSTDSHPVRATDYAAAFFALLFWLVYELLRRKVLMPQAPSAPRLIGRHSPMVVLHPPRGPTPSLLQVFRL
jgi:hypothetical protein